MRDMTQVDVARLRRVRAAVAGTLERVPEKSAHGLPPTYNSLRAQVLDAVPEGLRAEVEAVAAEVRTSARDVIVAARDGAEAYARLAALKGWLDAVIDAGN
jgi:hypothetical protein